MFEAGLPFDGDPELREAADRAFAVLRRAADAFCARLPSERRPPALMMSLHLWALAHGIASLFGRADGGRRKLPMSPEELLEAGVLVYLRGLSLTRAASKPHVNVKYIHMRPFDDARGKTGRFGESGLDCADGGGIPDMVAARPRRSGLSGRQRADGTLDRLRSSAVASASPEQPSSE
jgi:hypothetical protein